MGVHLQPREGSVSVRRDGFSTYHPMICAVYFVIILICSMIFMAPACLSALFAGAFSYAIYITGKKAVKTFLCLCLPVMAAAVLVNFLFNHHGVTILFYIGDNPITKEALCYGAASASVFASVIIWCCCVSIASSDAEEKAYLPAAARIYADMCDMKTVAGDKGPKSVTGIPLDIVEGRRWLRQRIIAGAGARVGSASLSISPDRKNTLEYRTDVFEPGYGESIDSHEDKKSDISADGHKREKPAIEARDIWFRYGRNGRDILKGFDIRVCRGTFYALVGGNGTGKTTALKVICGILKAYRGKLRNVAEGLLLTQDPKNVFVEETVRENLERVYNARIVKDRHGQKNPHDKKMNTDMTPSGYIKKMEGCTSTRGRTMNEKKQEGDIEVISERLGISHILDMHPYDISGGEQQRVALGMLLLMRPEVFLMDEPTKGMDPFFKEEFAGIVSELKSEGKTILTVSHDIEFYAKYVDRVGMMFDGQLTAEGTPHKVFGENRFYTTAASKITRGLLENALTADDITKALRLSDYGKTY